MHFSLVIQALSENQEDISVPRKQIPVEKILNDKLVKTKNVQILDIQVKNYSHQCCLYVLHTKPKRQMHVIF